MIPEIFRADYEKLTDAQRQKFHELLAWAGASALQGVPVPITTFENIFKMVKQMGEEPVQPIEPDRTVNHDWNFAPKQGKNQ